MTLEDSPGGLRYTVKLPNTTAGNDLAESISRGDLDATSFGFDVPKGSDTWTEGNKRTVRTLNAINLAEVSPCSFPAYPDSTLALRSCPAEIRAHLEQPEEQEPNQETRSKACSCDCAECVAGNCEDCSNPDCDDEACGCEDDLEAERTRNHMHMTLALRQR